MTERVIASFTQLFNRAGIAISSPMIRASVEEVMPEIYDAVLIDIKSNFQIDDNMGYEAAKRIGFTGTKEQWLPIATDLRDVLGIKVVGGDGNI
jgi:hypothetical protein